MFSFLFFIIIVALSGGWKTIFCDFSNLEVCQFNTSEIIYLNNYLATTIGTAFSAIGTAVLIITIFYTAKTAQASITAAEAANRAIVDTRESNIRELRPYLAVDNFRAMYVIGIDKKVDSRRIDITWQNVGMTPARNIRSKTNSLISEESLPDNFDFPDRIMSDAVGTLGREKFFTSPTRDHSIEEISSVLKGETHLHVWSWVEYEGFESGVIYRSEYYCRICFWGSDDPRDVNLQSNSLLGERFNGIDRDCMKLSQANPSTPAHI